MKVLASLYLEKPHLIYSFDQFGKPGVINPDVQRQTIEALLTGNRPSVDNCITPEFVRLAPPLHITEDEVRILTKYYHHAYFPKFTLLKVRMQYMSWPTETATFSPQNQLDYLADTKFRSRQKCT